MSVVRTTAKTPVKIQRDIYFSLTYERTKAQISKTVPTAMPGIFNSKSPMAKDATDRFTSQDLATGVHGRKNSNSFLIGRFHSAPLSARQRNDTLY